MDCRVWVATEWIFCCSATLLEELKAPNEELDKFSVQTLRGGVLYGTSSPPRSLDRWEYWKKKLAELAKSEDLGLENETKTRVHEALKIMESQS
jgi:hypothetical protein